mmetsp:Transcript_3772/g.5313  ORF Transcript_3772/g.5313 Transcript_3772/m.5313 type:complete len:124 (+) Transcript_3772:1908-2279(+)
MWMAENGQQAVNDVVQDLNKYHVIFMDNQMPVLGGIDATRKIREAGFLHLIVGVTGYSLEEDVTEYLMAGADLILSKPMRMDVLDMLLAHVKGHGYLSKPGMTLVSDTISKTLIWVSESTNKV